MDLTYLVLVLPAVLFSLWASGRVKSTYETYRTVWNRRGLSGAEAARRVLVRHGVSDVRVTMTDGELTDHFDPKEKVIRLSSEVYSGISVASVGIACHEAGHAVQHAEDYGPIRLRTAIIPITNIGSRLAMPLILIGLLLEGFIPMAYQLVRIGILCFALSAFFQLVTLPTEFNASRRAMQTIEQDGLLTAEEQKGAKKVLSAAALTYVAALAVALTQLLRLIVLYGGGGRKKE